MHKFIFKTFGRFAKKGYEIKGENNKIILVENGVERSIRPKEKLPGIDITINGNNNTVKLELPIKSEKSTILIENDNVNIDIASPDAFGTLYIRCSYGNGQTVKIGRGVTAWGAQLMLVGESAISIGEDCMISTGVSIWADDAHSIIDLDTNKILNKPTGTVTIGDHCWIGQGVRINKNARIGNHCIVGGGTVAVKDYPENNVIIVGNPGKIVKRNITWDRRSTYLLEQMRKENQKTK